jgi:N-acetylglucosamine kinase-like BadF-type ATPase
MSTLLSPYFPQSHLSVVNDAHLLGGPLLKRHSPWGIAVIAGTGSVVVGLDVVDGEVSGIGRRGGVGYLLGDDGSGKFYSLRYNSSRTVCG